MDNERKLVEALEEQRKEVEFESAENFKPADVSTMNRAERRDRLAYFKRELKKHVKRKPSMNITEEDPVKQQEGVDRMQRWATRYAILLHKIQELGSKRNR